MGSEFGQEREWNHDHSPRLASARRSRAIAASSRWCATSTALYRKLPALHELDCDHAGFEWIVTNDADHSVFAWMRKGSDARARCLVVANFTPQVHHDYRSAGAVRRPLARSAEHRLRASMAAATSGTAVVVETLSGAVPEAETDDPAARGDLPGPGSRLMRVSEGSPVRSAQPGMAAARISRCSRPTPRRSSCACSTRRAGARSNASRCPNAPTTSGTAICTMHRRASSTAIASTGPTSPNAAIASTHHKLLLDPYAKTARRTAGLERRPFRLSHGQRARRPVVRPARQCARHAQGGRRRRQLQLGRGASDALISPGKTPSSTKPTSKA